MSEIERRKSRTSPRTSPRTSVTHLGHALRPALRSRTSPRTSSALRTCSIAHHFFDVLWSMSMPEYNTRKQWSAQLQQHKISVSSPSPILDGERAYVPSSPRYLVRGEGLRHRPNHPHVSRKISEEPLCTTLLILNYRAENNCHFLNCTGLDLHPYNHHYHGTT